MNLTSLQAKIAELEHLRKSRVILYLGQDRGHFSHQISEDDVLPLYRCLLQEKGRPERLDLVLHTMGGSISTAHWLCHLLSAYGKQFNVLVPLKARSAGTLLCLGAHEIVMGSCAQLGPIDPQMAQRAPSAASNPSTISSEDIRAFRHMAKIWFGIEERENSVQLLQLLCERIFPTSLTAFFRAARQIETMTEQHLRVHLPEASPEQRQKIAEYFIHECYSHDHIITREDAQEISLAVTCSSRQEEELLWQIWEICSQDVLSSPVLQVPEEEKQQVVALIASTDFLARCVVHITRIQKENGVGETQQPARLIVEEQWETEYAVSS